MDFGAINYAAVLKDELIEAATNDDTRDRTPAALRLSAERLLQPAAGAEVGATPAAAAADASNAGGGAPHQRVRRRNARAAPTGYDESASDEEYEPGGATDEGWWARGSADGTLSTLLSVGRIAALLEAGGVLVDVRTTAQYRRGHVAGAVSIPLTHLDPEARALRQARVGVAVYGARGDGRAAAAKTALLAAGRWDSVIAVESIADFPGHMDDDDGAEAGAGEGAGAAGGAGGGVGGAKGAAAAAAAEVAAAAEARRLRFLLPPPTVGILSGISFVSGVEYYKQTNVEFQAISAREGKIMPPNPPQLLVSIDCDSYGAALTAEDWDAVDEQLLAGVERLVRGGADFLALASNTAHIAAPAIERRFPQVPLLHIADVIAAECRRHSAQTVGLIGTKFTMEQPYLRARLQKHGLTVLVPESTAIFRYIRDEFSADVFSDEARAYFRERIAELSASGAQAVVLGCTEIELLDLSAPTAPEAARVAGGAGAGAGACAGAGNGDAHTEADAAAAAVEAVPLIESSRLHIEAIARVQAGGLALARSYLPLALRLGRGGAAVDVEKHMHASGLYSNHGTVAQPELSKLERHADARLQAQVLALEKQLQ